MTVSPKEGIHNQTPFFKTDKGYDPWSYLLLLYVTKINTWATPSASVDWQTVKNSENIILNQDPFNSFSQSKGKKNVNYY